MSCSYCAFETTTLSTSLEAFAYGVAFGQVAEEEGTTPSEFLCPAHLEVYMETLEDVRRAVRVVLARRKENPS